MMKKILLSAAVLTLAFSFHLFSREAPDRQSGPKGMWEVGPFGEFDQVLPEGSPAPEFTLKTVEGEAVSLSSFRGKVVVIEFGART